MLEHSHMERPQAADLSDAALVALALEGDRHAFARIVARYQALLCSIAYSALGSLAHSEDLAQEAFVEAWKKLPNLDDPDRLKAWLCGILRFKVSHHRRSESRRAMGHTDTLAQADPLSSDTPNAEDYTMKEQEQALLWQALEKVPETYREVMILFYREEHSVANVAEELDLSEAAVKQRLSRGRKLLQERVLSFVEEALSRSTPGHVFTAGVIAALPLAITPAKAAGTGAIAAQAATAMKWTGFAAFLASASGIIGSAFALRAGLDQSRTARERRRVVRVVIAFIGTALLWTAAMFGLRQMALASGEYPAAYAWTAQGLVIAFVAGYAWLTWRLLSGSRRLRAAERLRRPDRFRSEFDQPDSPRREYRSRLRLFGIPLVHVKFAGAEQGETPAIGWIAGGEVAYGVLFAWGGFAVGFVSVGIVSLGVLSLGAVGVGLLGLGTVGVGFIAFGAAAIGWKAYGSLAALGWQGAFSNAFSVAREGAVGPVALAEQVNNAEAAALANLAEAGAAYGFVLLMITALVLVPVTLYARAVRKRMRGQTDRE